MQDIQWFGSPLKMFDAAENLLFLKDACAEPLSSFFTHSFLFPTTRSVLSQDSERKGFMNKLYAIQDVCISVQNALDEVASYGERIKKWVVSLFLGTRPFLLPLVLLQ